MERRQLCGGVNLRGVLDQSKYDCSAMDHMMLIPAACVFVCGPVGLGLELDSELLDGMAGTVTS